jgi:hypothetical protein
LKLNKFSEDFGIEYQNRNEDLNNLYSARFNFNLDSGNRNLLNYSQLNDTAVKGDQYLSSRANSTSSGIL